MFVICSSTGFCVIEEKIDPVFVIQVLKSRPDLWIYKLRDRAQIVYPDDPVADSIYTFPQLFDYSEAACTAIFRAVADARNGKVVHLFNESIRPPKWQICEPASTET